jgi:hypothetical protein
MTPEQLQQILDALKEISDKIDKALPAPDAKEGDAKDGGDASFARTLADPDREELEKFRWGAKIDKDPALVGIVTPGNRDAIIGNLIRFSKLTEKASFSRATADGKGIETGEGTEAEAYYESLKAMPAAFSRETVAKSSTARTAGDTTAAERIEARRKAAAN